MTMELKERLQEERKKNGVSQKIISELTGLTPRGYRNYEQDAANLTVETLLRLEQTGMDIFYIIFGKRLANTLTADEQMIIESYRAMSVREKGALLGMLNGLQNADKGVRVKGKVNQYVEGNASGHYAEGNIYTVQVEKKPL